MPGKEILVVDDEEDILELVRYNLVKQGLFLSKTPSEIESLDPRMHLSISSDAVPDDPPFTLTSLAISGIERLSESPRYIVPCFRFRFSR